jgi:hypothetical protein
MLKKGGKGGNPRDAKEGRKGRESEGCRVAPCDSVIS